MNVDAVITWVDGNDLQHIQKRKFYTSTDVSITTTSEALLPTRFNSSGEIQFCVQSLLKYAPWLRYIYLVTDAQTPDIPQHPKIKIIDHQEIFKDYEQYLPQFNSLNIEAMLWRIEGLSEHFIYLNDDCFLIKPCTPADFYLHQQTLITAHKKRLYNTKLRLPFLAPKPISAHRARQELSARLMGFNTYFYHLPHIPFALKRSVFEELFTNYHELYIKNLQFKFRDSQQFWPISMAYHYEISNGNTNIKACKHELTINAQTHTLKKITHRLNKSTHPDLKFACIQSLDAAPNNIQQMLINWLTTQIDVNLNYL